MCLCVLFYSSFVYTCVTVRIFLYIQSPLRECRSIRSGASGLPYSSYCAPLVCVSAVIELLAVWRHHKPKTNCDPLKQKQKKCRKKERKKESGVRHPLSPVIELGLQNQRKKERKNLSMSMREGGDLGEYIFLKSADSSSLSKM